MISIGGNNPSDEALGEFEDAWTNGIGIFDMTAFAWSDSYDANATEYESPDVVKEYYSSSFTTPNWSNPTLAEVFAPATGSSPSQADPTETPAAASGEDAGAQTSKSSKTGAIAGGVVGGIGGLVIIGALLWWFRRKQRAKQSQQSDEIADPSSQTGGAVEYYNTNEKKELSPVVLSEVPSQLEVNQLRHELAADPPGPKVHSRFNEIG